MNKNDIEHFNALKKDTLLQNKYKIEKVLGSPGGFGIAYLANNINIDKLVVIKEFLPDEIAYRDNENNHNTILPKTSTDKDNLEYGLERFKEEAKTLAKFNHHNIVKVLDYFEENNTAYFIMDYEKGKDLDDYLKQSNKNILSQEEILSIIIPILDGLKEVHSNNFLHRDIKPGNIYIRDSGSPMLIDFGAARNALGVKSKSITQILTPGYAPTEQYGSNTSKQGAFSDIYSLGAVIYKLITGKTPIDSTDRGNAVFQDDEPDPLIPATKTINHKDYTKEFLEAIEWSLEIKPKDRPQNVVEFRDRLLKLEEDEEEQNKEQNKEQKEQEQETNKEKIDNNNQNKTPPQKPKKEKEEIENKINSNNHKNNSSNYNNKIKILAIIGILVAIGISTLIYNNGQETKRKAYLIKHPIIRTFKGHTDDVTLVSPIPNTNKIISGSKDKTIKLWNINTGELIRTFKGHTNGVRSVSPIPNTNKIISGSWDTTIKLWNINTGELIRTFKGHTNGVRSVSPIPNTNKIISGSDDKTIKLWNINTGELIRTFKGHTNDVDSVSPIPNTNKIISGSSDTTIKLWNINTGELIRTFKGHTSYVLSVSPIPNTNKIISGSYDNTIKLWNINTGELIRTFKGHTSGVYSVSPIPNTNKIISGSKDKTIKLWNINTGELIRTFKGHTSGVYSVSPIPNTNKIISGSTDKTIKLWNINP